MMMMSRMRMLPMVLLYTGGNPLAIRGAMA